MAQFDRLDITINAALKKGWLAGRTTFMVIPVSRERDISCAADVAAVLTAYTDYFDCWDNLPEKVAEWLGDGDITVAANGIILWG